MNSNQPPTLAALLLRLAPREYRVYLAGDLHEEFVRRGYPRRWYWRQVARSLPGLAALRMRHSRWSEPLVVSLVAGSWLLVAWHVLWSFVLSQVPLKADPVGWWFQ